MPQDLRGSGLQGREFYPVDREPVKFEQFMLYFSTTAVVAKWLRQRFVAPLSVGSNPIDRPQEVLKFYIVRHLHKSNTKQKQSTLFSDKIG